MKKVSYQLKMSLFYKTYKLLDRIRNTDLYGSDTLQTIQQMNTSWYSTAFYPGLLTKIFQHIPKDSIEGVLDMGSGKGWWPIKFRQFGIRNVGGGRIEKRTGRYLQQKFGTVQNSSAFSTE